jgi:putative membrane-bound dehydrogenase-like protein
LNDDFDMDIAPGPGTNSRPRRHLNLRRATQVCLIFLLVRLFCASSRSGEPPASSNTVTKAAAPAAQTMSSFRLEPGFKMELVAAEPMVSAPVAIAFDEDGRLFVAEMPQSGSRGEPTAAGRVRILEGTDERGAARSSKIYAQELAAASALVCYAGGIFVAAGSEVLYLKDTHHDGGADVRQVVLSGFGGTNSNPAAARLNNFKWGLDNRVHAATAGIGGTIAAANWPGDPVSLDGSDFSFNPRTLAVFRDSGPAQSGLTFDDWGRRFVSDWAKPLRLALYDERYLERNPYQPKAAAMVDVVSPGLVVYPATGAVNSTVAGNPTRLTAATNGPPRAWLNHASGPLIYRGSLFPSNYLGNAFIADPEAHVIHRALLRDYGFGISAERPPEGRASEFLASRDPAFRPVQVMDGPDGALYVVDQQDGQDRGRIYRIVPATFQRPKPPELGKARTFDLVSALAGADGWHRDNAARLLFERREPAAAPFLGEMLTNSRSPLARMQVLWALDGTATLREAHLLRGLGDPDSRVREQAVWLAYRAITNGVTSDLFWDQLKSLAGDQALRVRYAVAFAAGNVRRPDKATVLATILRHDPGNPWVQTAVLSSAVDGGGVLLRTLAADPAVRNDAAGLAFLSELSMMIGVQGRLDEVVQSLLYVANASLDAGPAMTLLAGIGEGLHRTRSSIALLDPQGVLQPFYVQALAAAVNGLLPEQTRIAAVDLLSFSSYTIADTGEWLLNFFDMPTLPRLQAVAMTVLARYNDPQVVPNLLSHWPAMRPSARNQALAALLSHTGHVPEVLEAIAGGKISVDELSSVQRNFLRTFRDPAVRERALKILGPMPRERRQALDRLQTALRINGDPRHGRELFATRCADCHRLSGVGQALGPDLLASRTRGKSALLSAILQPNAAIPREYATCVIETKDGENVVGILAEETPLTLTVRQPGGGQQVWPKLNVESNTIQDWSLMPEGLEEGLSAQDMADLLEYLMTTPR